MRDLPCTAEICFPKKICKMFLPWGAGGGFLPAFGQEKTKWFHHRGGWVLQGYDFKQRPDLIAAGQPRWAPRRDSALFLEASLQSSGNGLWVVVTKIKLPVLSPLSVVAPALYIVRAVASRVVDGGAQWAQQFPALPFRGPGCSSRPAWWSLCSLTALCRNPTLVETVMHVSTWQLQPSESTLSASSSSTPRPLAATFFSPLCSAVCLSLCFVTVLPDFRHSALSSDSRASFSERLAQCTVCSEKPRVTRCLWPLRVLMEHSEPWLGLRVIWTQGFVMSLVFWG